VACWGTVRPGIPLVLLVAATTALAAEPAELLGRWVSQSGPARVLELKPGGTGTIDGAPLTWSVQETRLTITDPGGTDTTGWKVVGDRLVLAGPFDTEMVFRREAPGGSGRPRPPTPPSG
jgi:hypothetical protein